MNEEVMSDGNENEQLTILGVSRSALRNLIQEFRMWNNEWEKFDNKQITKNPMSVDDFVEEMNKKYVVGYTHCG